MCYKKMIKKFNKIFIPITIALCSQTSLVSTAAEMEELMHAKEAPIKFGFFQRKHTRSCGPTSKSYAEKVFFQIISNI